MPGKYICGKVFLARYVYDLEFERQRFFFVVDETRVVDILEFVIAEHFQEWSVIHGNNQAGQSSHHILVCSRVSATASASPSIGAYLDSAGWVKRLLTRVTFHPSRQQNGASPGQVQCFCSRKNPMPSFDQSVAKHVFLPFSNILTPYWIALTMCCFDSSKSCCSCWSQ